MKRMLQRTVVLVVVMALAAPLAAAGPVWGLGGDERDGARSWRAWWDAIWTIWADDPDAGPRVDGPIVGRDQNGPAIDPSGATPPPPPVPYVPPPPTP